MQNFTVRFVYETFFELVLCVMISLAVRDPYTADNFSTQAQIDAKMTGVGGSYEDYDHLSAGVTLSLLTLLLFYVLSFSW